MLTNYHTLETEVAQSRGYFVPLVEKPKLTLDSSARAAMIDFSTQPPLRIRSDVLVTQAESFLNILHAYKLFVTNANGDVLGVVTAKDLEETEDMGRAEELQHSVPEMTLYELMTPLNKIYGVDANGVAIARIGDMLKTMHKLGQPFLLVYAHHGSVLQGLITTAHIIELLNVPLHEEMHACDVGEIVPVIQRNYCE